MQSLSLGSSSPVWNAALFIYNTVWCALREEALEPRREGEIKKWKSLSLLLKSSKCWSCCQEVNRVVTAHKQWDLLDAVVTAVRGSKGKWTRIPTVGSVLFPFSTAALLHTPGQSPLTRQVARGCWDRPVVFLWEDSATWTWRME